MTDSSITDEIGNSEEDGATDVKTEDVSLDNNKNGPSLKKQRTANLSETNKFARKFSKKLTSLDIEDITEV